MSWYSNNQSNAPATAVGTFPQPLYWWEAGAIWVETSPAALHIQDAR